MRFSAWLLLVEHPRKTQPLTVDDCRLMAAYLETNMGEQRPAIRQKLLAGVKKVWFLVSERFEKRRGRV